MNKKDTLSFIIIILTVTCIFLIISVVFMNSSIKDKNAYINGLLSDRAICEGKLDTVTLDYERLYKDYEKLKGDIDG